MPDTPINRPGATTNPPHTAREGTGISDYHPDPADAGAAPPVSDHDPHPADEGHPYAGDPIPPERPASSTPHYLDIEPNPAVHTGTAEPKPDNADHGPKYSPG